MGADPIAKVTDNHVSGMPLAAVPQKKRPHVFGRIVEKGIRHPAGGLDLGEGVGAGLPKGKQDQIAPPGRVDNFCDLFDTCHRKSSLGPEARKTEMRRGERLGMRDQGRGNLPDKSVHSHEASSGQGTDRHRNFAQEVDSPDKDRKPDMHLVTDPDPPLPENRRAGRRGAGL